MHDKPDVVLTANFAIDVTDLSTEPFDVELKKRDISCFEYFVEIQDAKLQQAQALCYIFSVNMRTEAGFGIESGQLLSLTTAKSICLRSNVVKMWHGMCKNYINSFSKPSTALFTSSI